jgi:hypothetical protein
MGFSIPFFVQFIECEILCSFCWGCLWVLFCNSYQILVIMFVSNRLPDTAVGRICLDMNFFVLSWGCVVLNGMICSNLEWNLLGVSEENTSTWHLGYLTLDWDLSLVHTQNTNTASSVDVRSAWCYGCIRLPVICVFVCCVCVFLRYPALQQTLPMSLIVSSVIIIMSVNTYNPVTAL